MDIVHQKIEQIGLAVKYLGKKVYNIGPKFSYSGLLWLSRKLLGPM